MQVFLSQNLTLFLTLVLWCSVFLLAKINSLTYLLIKIIRFLKKSCLLIKGVSKSIKNKAKEQRSRFLGRLLGTLGASLLENMLTGKGIMRAGEGPITDGSGF